MPAAREDDDVPDRRDVVRDSLGVGLATGLYGASFGALGVASGLSVLQTCAMSFLIFTGASQFAFVGVLASGGAPLSGALTALLLGSRNTLYGLRLAPLLALSRWRRLGVRAPGHRRVDGDGGDQATTALARTGFYWTGLSIFALWNLFTFLGAVAGSTDRRPATTASTPRSGRPSWPSCGRGCTSAQSVSPSVASRRWSPCCGTGDRRGGPGARGGRRRPAGRRAHPRSRRRDGAS